MYSQTWPVTFLIADEYPIGWSWTTHVNWIKLNPEEKFQQDANIQHLNN